MEPFLFFLKIAHSFWFLAYCDFYNAGAGPGVALKMMFAQRCANDGCILQKFSHSRICLLFVPEKWRENATQMLFGF